MRYKPSRRAPRSHQHNGCHWRRKQCACVVLAYQKRDRQDKLLCWCDSSSVSWSTVDALTSVNSRGYYAGKTLFVDYVIQQYYWVVRFWKCVNYSGCCRTFDDTPDVPVILMCSFWHIKSDTLERL